MGNFRKSIQNVLLRNNRAGGGEADTLHTH